MKQLSFYLFCSIFLFTACDSEQKGEEEANGQDSINAEQIADGPSVDPKVILDNDHAGVLEVRIPAGGQLNPHQAPRRIIFSLSDYEIKWLSTQNSPELVERKEGQAHFYDGNTHSANNVGNTEAHWVVFTRKPEALLSCLEETENSEALDNIEGGFTDALVKNEHFEAYRVKLLPGEILPKHQAKHRILYALEDVTLYHEATGKEAKTMQLEKGDAKWFGPCPHLLQNKTNKEAEFLVVHYLSLNLD